MTQEEMQAIRAMMEDVTKASETRMGQMMDEKLENALDPIHKKLTILESLPKQINAIANGHANITRQMENLSAQVNSLEKKLDNSVIVKAVTPTI